jgi:hypothetical protein
MFFSFTGYPPSLAAIPAIGKPRQFPALLVEPGNSSICPRSADLAPKTVPQINPCRQIPVSPKREFKTAQSGIKSAEPGITGISDNHRQAAKQK